jgi:hypothetical protein
VGRRVFGEVPCDPPGTARVFMTEELNRSASSSGGSMGIA